MKTGVLTENMCDIPPEYATSEEWYANDLQLAAELGKGLLDRNTELEGRLRHQQQLVEDQAQEIQMLSRQSAALKEINESRLRVYEQLEASIADLENTNQQLREEMSSDKKRAKSLCQSVDALESKCLELQQLVDDFKTSERKRRIRRKADPIWTTADLTTTDELMDSNVDSLPCVSLQRRHSFQNQQQQEDAEWAVRLRSTVSKLKCQLAKEETTSNDLKAQVQILLHENSQLLEQQKQLEEQRERLIFYHQAERLYWSCMHCRRSRMETQQEAEESDDSLLASSSESFSLIELENGSLAYGDGDSLSGTLLDTANIPVDRNRISLLSELDSQYRTIIKKYEDLLLSSGSPSIDSSESAVDDVKETSLFRSLSQQSEVFSSTCSSGVSSLQEDEDVGDNPALEERGVQTEEQNSRKEFSSDSSLKQLFDDIFAVLKRSAPLNITQTNDATATCTNESTGNSESRGNEVCPPVTKKKSLVRHFRQRKSGTSEPYFVPVPSLTGFPLFKLPGMHSYAQIVKMNPRFMINSAFIK